VIAEVGRCGCCTDLVCQNGQLVVDPLADWQPVELFQAGRAGKSLVWDVTLATTLAESNVDMAAIGAGLVTEQAARWKLCKYMYA